MNEPQQATVLVLHGRLVAATVHSLEPMIAGLLIVDRPRLVVDLSRVAVCDMAGAALLLGAARLARQRGGELRLAAPSPVVCRWLADDATMTEIPAFTSVESAVDADEWELLAPVPCIDGIDVDALDPWRSTPVHAVFGSGRPLWRATVSSSDRARQRRGPASRRR
jgi:anti-anti-sigma factor